MLTTTIPTMSLNEKKPTTPPSAANASTTGKWDAGWTCLLLITSLIWLPGLWESSSEVRSRLALDVLLFFSLPRARAKLFQFELCLNPGSFLFLVSSSTAPHTPRTYRRIIEQVNLFCWHLYIPAVSCACFSHLSLVVFDARVSLVPRLPLNNVFFFRDRLPAVFWSSSSSLSLLTIVVFFLSPSVRTWSWG